MKNKPWMYNGTPSITIIRLKLKEKEGKASCSTKIILIDILKANNIANEADYYPKDPSDWLKIQKQAMKT